MRRSVEILRISTYCVGDVHVHLAALHHVDTVIAIPDTEHMTARWDEFRLHVLTQLQEDGLFKVAKYSTREQSILDLADSNRRILRRRCLCHIILINQVNHISLCIFSLSHTSISSTKSLILLP